MVEDEESTHALNRFRGLFLSARNALLWMSLLQFTKVFDGDTRTVSLRVLVNAAKNDPSSLLSVGAEESALTEVERQLVKTRSCWSA